MRAVTNEMVERANLSEKMVREVSFRAIPDTAPYKPTLKKYLKDLEQFFSQGIGLYLWSDKNGTGKTGTAQLIGKHALMRGYSVYFIRVEEMLEAILENRGFDEFTTISQRIRDVDLLILDELGKETIRGKSGYAEGKVEDMLRGRIQKGRTNIITSNLSPKSIAQEYSLDMSDILKEAFKVVEVVDDTKGGKLWREEKRQYINRLFEE